jgi:hypothetical protein
MQDKIHDQASTVIQKAMSLSYVLIQSQQGTARKTWIASLFLSLGLGGGLWFTTEANTPQLVQAQTVGVDLAIDRQPNETYESLLSRAEAAAKAAVEKSFAQNRGATDVSIVVVANNQGEIAPVLSLEANRSAWLGSNAQRSITYFNQARSLLGFDEDIATSSPARQPQNTPNTTPAPQPRTTSPTPLKQPSNSNPGSIRQGGNNTLTQPGSIVSPPASRQPTNNLPSESEITNPTTTPGGPTPTPGTRLNPQAPTSNPAAPLSQPQNTNLPYLSPQPSVTSPVVPPVNSQGQTPLNNASPSNSNTLNPANTLPNTNGNTRLNPPEITIPSSVSPR